MATIYLVLYHEKAVAAFSTEQLAQEYIKRRQFRKGWRDYEVANFYGIKTVQLDGPTEVVFVYYVEMDKAGEVFYSDLQELDIKNPEGFVHWSTYGEGSLVWRVGTSNLEEAIRVVNEKRRQILWEGTWGGGNPT